MLAWLVAFALWANAAEAEAPEKEASLVEFFTTFAQSRDAIGLLEATFIQTTVTPDEIIVSEGQIVYVRPKRLIFRYDDPPLVYMIDSLRAYEYDPELEQVQIFELEDRPESEAFYLGFENNAEQLQEAYNVRLLPASDPSRYALALEFEPKSDDEDQAYFKKVILQLRRGDFLPAEIRIINDEESHVEFRVSDFKINGQPDPEKTHIVLPEGTVIVDNDRYAGEVGPEGLRLPRAAEGRVESEPLTEGAAPP